MRFAALLLLLGAGVCRADEDCPFLNTATAAGVLGGEVTSHVEGPNCVFKHSSSQLSIKVETVTLPYKPNCQPSPTPITGIGNEAVACSNEASNNMPEIEQVAGRVRDRAFLITLQSKEIPRATLREKARSIAEQVAGVLF